MRKVTALILCIAFAAMLFSSCSDSDVTALYFALSTTADEFDPAITSDGVGTLIVRNCFEGLLSIDSEGNILPAAAESYTVSSDGLTYTFNLRSGMKWHMTSNAKEELEDKLPENFDLSVTAQDFVFGIKHALNPETGSKDAYKLSAISGAENVLNGTAGVDTLGIKAVSATQLVITLSAPQSNFPEVLTEPMCMPCNETFFNACGGRYGRYIRYTLSNGPFYLSYFDETNYKISKNPDYTGLYTANADVIRFYTVTDTDSLYTKLKAGDYSGAFLSESRYSELKELKKTQTFSVNDKTRAFVFNAQSETLSNENIRKALILATDSEAVAEEAEKTSVSSFVPSVIKGCENFGKTEYNEEKAKELLTAALKELDVQSVTLTISCEEQHEILIKKLLQKWQKLFGTSLTVNVETLTASGLENKVKNGGYDIAFYPVCTSSFSPASFFAMFVSGAGENIFGINNEALDGKISALGALSGDSLYTACKNVASIITENAVILPVWNESSYFIGTEALSGIVLLPGTECAYLYNCK